MIDVAASSLHHGIEKHGIEKHGIEKHGIEKHGIEKHGIEKHGIEKHEGKTPGEDSFGLVLRTMHQRTFSRQGIGVDDGKRVVATKHSESGMGAEVDSYRRSSLHTSERSSFYLGELLRESVRITAILGSRRGVRVQMTAGRSGRLPVPWR